MNQSNFRSPQSSQRTQSLATKFFAPFAFFGVKSRCVTPAGWWALTLALGIIALLLLADGAGAAADTQSQRTYEAGDMILRADHIWIALWDSDVPDVADASNCAKNAILLKEGYTLALDAVFQKTIPATGSIRIANFSLFRNGEIIKKANVTGGEFFYYNMTADGTEYPVIEFRVDSIFSADGGYCSGWLIRLMQFNQYSDGAGVIWLNLTNSPAHLPPSEEWNRTFPGMDAEAAMSVQETEDGGYLLVRSYIPEFPANKWSSPILLNRTDDRGIELWNITISEIKAQVYSIQRTSDGGFAAAGDVLKKTHFTKEEWLVKIGTNGDKMWERMFGGIYDDTASLVRQTGDGGYFLLGTKGESGGAPWLIRTDPNGKEMWNRTLAMPIYSKVNSLQWTDDNGCIIAGTIGTYFADFNDAMLFKLDANGSEQWNRTFGGKYDDRFFSVLQTRDGGYLAAGMTELYGHDSWLVKTDANGSEMWNRTLYDGGGSEALDVLETGDGYVLAGRKLTSEGKEALFVKTDLYGNKQWSRTFGGELDDEVSYVRQTGDGGYILAGNTRSYGSGKKDAWLVKMSREPDGNATVPVVNTNEIASPIPTLTAIPMGTAIPAVAGFEAVLAITALLLAITIRRRLLLRYFGDE